MFVNRQSQSQKILTSISAAAPPDLNVKSLYVVLDNSNIWIEGQRAYSSQRRDRDEFDRTWRVNVGALLDVIKSYPGEYTRRFCEGTLFG